MMYHNRQAVVQVNERRSRAFAIVPLLYVLALETLLRRFRDKRTNPALRGVPFAGPLTARVSAFADDITVFVYRRLDIKTVKKAVGEYERSILTKAKVFGSVLGGVAIPFQGPSAGVTDPSPSSGCGSGPTSNWNEIGRKYKLR